MTISKRKIKLNKIIEWLIHIIGYSLILILMSKIFDDTIIINNDYYGAYALIITIIIYILNQTVKPILVHLTLPITGLTLGLFYPTINVLILYITSFILGNNFQIHGLIIPFIIAIIISLLNVALETSIIKPIIKKGRDKNE